MNGLGLSLQHFLLSSYEKNLSDVVPGYCGFCVALLSNCRALCMELLQMSFAWGVCLFLAQISSA